MQFDLIPYCYTKQPKYSVTDARQHDWVSKGCVDSAIAHKNNDTAGIKAETDQAWWVLKG